jgi:glycosyltransferase 2 family protein
VAISLGLIAYIVTRPTILHADWGYMLANLRPGPWLVGLAVYFLAIGLNVYKWQYLLNTLGVHVPYRDLFRHNLVGLFFANLLNMIGADVARGWDLARGMEGTPGVAAPVAVSVLVDRLVGLAAFLVAAVAGLAYAVVSLGRGDMSWLLTTMIVVLAAYALAFALLMSQRLRRLAEKIFGLGPLARLLPLYRRVSDSVQVYRTHAGALVVAFGLGLATVAATCAVNYLAAMTVGAKVPAVWVFILTPLTAFVPFIPSIAAGLGVNQGVFVALYSGLAGLLTASDALAMSLAMQVIIYASSLPGGVLWWGKRGRPA